MKSTVLLAVFAMVLTTSTFAKTKKTSEPVSSKTVTVTGSFNKVLIGANLNVVLINDLNGDVTIEGNSKFLNNVKIENINGTLTVSSVGRSSSLKGTIYIPVKNLTRLDLMPDSKVVSNGFLYCNNLHVYLSKGSTAELKNKGEINIDGNANTELEYLKYLMIKM